ncbi:metal dependent hydrolase [Legionella moravica]|uniref:Endoribonuclease YbeY n=1 Tax=Legionella moravica TaxID=39962 RepID=A0A378JXV2_9GAMM|nr:rRNA maturation RNase YbeY [Legionella moravica]KTD34257.1 metal dependent hydrolase [Legionella moravica]STX62867.1 metal-dependent hydrolase [Legionella moravica]
MTYHIDVQNATNDTLPLSETDLTELANLALRDHLNDAELTIRLVDAEEMTFLNNTYRQQNKTTNVLAFPCDLPDAVELECPLLGDIIICSPVLLEESKQLNKSLQEHWALIVIHGVLHLLGYDHIKDKDAKIMQDLEIKLLAELGYGNPYDLEGNDLE